MRYLLLIPCLLAACLFAASAMAITADELRGEAADNEHEAAQRKSRADTGQLGALLPEGTPGGTPKSRKYDAGGAAAGNTRTAAQKHVARARVLKRQRSTAASGVPGTGVSDTADLYIPPPRTSAAGNQAVVTDAVIATVSFGIRLGSWLNASLDRNTTSADQGSVELTLTGDAIGDRRTLPAGSTLFADKTINNATRRMGMVVTHGITPAGQEFQMRGIVFDPLKTPGLAGVYVIDKKAVASNGLMNGAIAAVGAAAGAANIGPIGAATNAGAQSVMGDVGQLTASNAAQPIIYVSPQALIIRVEKQF